MTVLPAERVEQERSRLDAQYCESVTRAHARTFALASAFLPHEKRRDAFAIYAFCREADDIVDGAPGRDRADVDGDLAAYRAQLRRALAGRAEGPVFRELARVVARRGVPAAVLEELLDGVAADLEERRYATWSDLAVYCEGVAASVGAMCTHVFGVDGDDALRDRAITYGRTLGVAMQLTNILRDVGEDAARGRCYLPDDDLAAFGLDRERVLRDPSLKDDPRWAQLMRHEIARARALYRAARPGIALLASDAQRCARACADGYSAILGAIEGNRYDSLTRRARVGHLAKAGILLHALVA